jgi:hypothetical protein
MILIKVLQNYLGQAFVNDGTRHTSLYQGGEELATKEIRYSSETYVLTTFFLILHVMGFFSATIYILAARGESALNWATLIYVLLMTYTILLIKGATRRKPLWQIKNYTKN